MKRSLLANALKLGLCTALVACTEDPAHIGRDSSAGQGGGGGKAASAGATGGKAADAGATGGKVADAGATGGMVASAGTTGLPDGSGGKDQATGGVGSAFGGSASTGGSGGSSNACGVAATSAAPYATKLRFTNNGTVPVWLWSGCNLGFDVTSCSDGYTKPQPIFTPCAPECTAGATPPCAVCGACLAEGKQVPQGAYVDFDWDGLLRESEEPPGQCWCYNMRVAEAGWYRVSVPVWTTDPAPQGSSTGIRPEPNFRVTTDFALAQAGSTITVDVSSRVCTFGANQTCNDRLEVSAVWGRCLANGTCQCNDGFVINPDTGRCVESCPNRAPEVFSGTACVTDAECGQNEQCTGCFSSTCQCMGNFWGCTTDCRRKCLPL